MKLLRIGLVSGVFLLGVFLAPQSSKALTTTLSPVGEGNFSDWTASTGTKADAVLTDDGDLTYITNSIQGETQTFSFATSFFPSSAVINSITLEAVVRRVSISGVSINLLAEKGVLPADMFIGSSTALTLGYGSKTLAMPVNPFTGLTWTAGDLALVNFGVRHNQPEVRAARATELKLIIDYELPPARLTVMKQVINDSGGTAGISDFALFVDGVSIVSGESNEFAPGSHMVSEADFAGYTGTFGGDCDGTGSVELAPGDNKTCIVTNDDTGGVIRGHKFEDKNGNGLKDAGDGGLEAQKIYLDMDNDGTRDPDDPTAVTDENGDYEFTELSPQRYTVREVQKDFWRQTFPVGERGRTLVHEVDLSFGETSEGNDFGNFHLNKITGYKWHDLNGDGIWQKDSEPPKAGWKIKLTGFDKYGKRVSRHVKTNREGEFIFHVFLGLGGAPYQVSEVARQNWRKTHPLADFYEVAVTESGQRTTEDVLGDPLHFGNQKLVLPADEAEAGRGTHD